MTTKDDAINDISAQFAIICLDPGLFSGLAGWAAGAGPGPTHATS